MNDSILTLTRRLAFFLIWVSFAVLSACTNKPHTIQGTSGQSPYPTIPTSMVSSSQGTQILSSYLGSYALLIGESQYTHGWSKLTTIPDELQQVQELLTAKGFHIERFCLNQDFQDFRIFWINCDGQKDVEQISFGNVSGNPLRNKRNN